MKKPTVETPRRLSASRIVGSRSYDRRNLTAEEQKKLVEVPIASVQGDLDKALSHVDPDHVGECAETR